MLIHSSRLEIAWDVTEVGWRGKMFARRALTRDDPWIRSKQSFTQHVTIPTRYYYQYT